MRRAGPPRTPHRGVSHVFYETRVLMGREYTLQRFAEEVLGGSIEAVTLGYIEKGERFPSEAVVRRLAAVRGQDPRELLGLLARDRILHAIGRELRRLLHTPQAVKGVEDAELAVRVSEAIAALPDDGRWIPVARWRTVFRAAPPRQKRKKPLSDALAKQVESILKEHNLVETRAGKVRRRGRHYEPQEIGQRQALAIEYCVLFLKGLLDRLVLPDVDKGTYLRNHYLNIERARLPEFHECLEKALRDLTEKFATKRSEETEFLNVLASATIPSDRGGV